MCKVMEYYENIAREEERRLIAEEMKRKDFALAQRARRLRSVQKAVITCTHSQNALG